MIGQVFSHYRIEDRLGSGAMGVVYLGRDLTLGRLVAIKFLAAELSADELATTRFMQEARAISMLDHPNICAIYEISRSAEGGVCIVMAHYDGQTLEQRMAAGPVPVAEALDITAQLVGGLAAAHARGIVHRDVKPSNVIITTTGLVKILDFGIAKLPESTNLTATRSSLGTPKYMAPEQISGKGADHRSDLWSAGVMLHALVTGETPFSGDSMPTLFFAVLNNDPPRLAESIAEATPGLQRIVDRCLAKDPEARYPDAATLLADLRALQRGMAPERLTTAGDMPLPPVKARPWMWTPARIGGVVAAVALAGVLAWHFFGGGPSEPLRVAVLPPEVTAAGDSDEVVTVAASTQVGLMRGLISLRGIAAVDPAELKGLDGTPMQIARGLSVGELVSAKLESVRENWHVTLSRLSGTNGQVLWTDEFTSPREDAQLLAEAMTARVIAGYKDHHSRPGAAIPVVDQADFDELIRLRSAAVGSGAQRLTEAQIYERLQALCRRSPNFLDAQLFYSQWARRMYAVASEPGYLRESQSAAERARRIAPWDLRAAIRLFAVALDAGQLERADSLVGEMRRLDPGNVEILVSQSDLAERRGRFEQAISLMQDVVRHQPARVYFKLLANREFKYGRVDSARVHLGSLMERYPEDPWPHSKMAELELQYGSLARAESIYVSLLRRGPNSIYLQNLGLCRVLEGHFEDAATAYRQSLEMAPENVNTNINLAECETYLGHHDAASTRFQRALELLKQSPSRLGWKDRVMAAHCLARLGQRQQAVETIQEALPQAGDDPDALLTAALVYAIVDERSSAIVSVRKAIEQGLGPRWFSSPPFESLTNDPDFQTALKAGQGRAKTS